MLPSGSRTGRSTEGQGGGLEPPTMKKERVAGLMSDRYIWSPACSPAGMGSPWLLGSTYMDGLSFEGPEVASMGCTVCGMKGMARQNAATSALKTIREVLLRAMARSRPLPLRQAYQATPPGWWRQPASLGR